MPAQKRFLYNLLDSDIIIKRVFSIVRKNEGYGIKWNEHFHAYIVLEIDEFYIKLNHYELMLEIKIYPHKDEKR